MSINSPSLERSFHHGVVVGWPLGHGGGGEALHDGEAEDWMRNRSISGTHGGKIECEEDCPALAIHTGNQVL